MWLAPRPGRFVPGKEPPISLKRSEYRPGA